MQTNDWLDMLVPCCKCSTATYALTQGQWVRDQTCIPTSVGEMQENGAGRADPAGEATGRQGPAIPAGTYYA